MLESKITLCGIKHSGKSSTARALGGISAWPVVDTDDTLGRQFFLCHGENIPVREIYRRLGEEKFRQLEAETLKRIGQQKDPVILSLGGGALSNPYVTHEIIQCLGFLCWLDVPDEVAYERIQQNGLPPFLQKEADPFAAFCMQNRQRRQDFQKVAHIRIDPTESGKDPEQTAQCIWSIYQEKCHHE